MQGPALPLQGSKVRLRQFEQADITNTYVGWLNDPRVVRFSNQRFVHHDRESCLRYLASFQNSPNLFVSVRSVEDDRALGTMTAYFAIHHGTVDVGILMGDPTTWGKGHGRDAWNTLTLSLIGLPSIRKVTAGTLSVNIPMIRLAEGSGMQLEGVRKAQEIVDGEAVDMLYFARFADVRSTRAAGDRLS